MAECTSEIVLAPEPETKARQLWKNTTVRRHVHAPLRDLLADMAAGRERCMYCGDNQATDIDHFEPIDRRPIRAFDWTNHLLACSLCNSHLKGAAFPLDEGGNPLLIDPTAEDPTPHLRLSWQSAGTTRSRPGARPPSTCSTSTEACWQRAG
ncbi:HNH endonuclease [Kitasatospora sp. NPDC087315]|uniref:HNH endonuclease n=1 Tax=Kitasatospora sp. NPDC087315 TaxID=3364069 RepID=UPI0037FEEB2A